MSLSDYEKCWSYQYKDAKIEYLVKMRDMFQKLIDDRKPKTYEVRYYVNEIGVSFKPIFQVIDQGYDLSPGWYFENAFKSNNYGPFSSFEDCHKTLKEYSLNLLSELTGILRDNSQHPIFIEYMTGIDTYIKSTQKL